MKREQVQFKHYAIMMDGYVYVNRQVSTICFYRIAKGFHNSGYYDLFEEIRGNIRKWWNNEN